MQLRESEERYRSIVNACPDDITIADLEGRILMVSPVGLTMFGYARQEQLLGRMITDFIVEEDRNRALSDIALLFQGKLTGPTAYKGLRADGSIFDFEAKGEFIRCAEGKPVSMVLVVRDLTERKRVEEAQRQWERQQQQLQKITSLNDMTGAIAHHFNNQLSVVIGNLEIAIDDLPFDTEPSKPLTDAMRAALKAAEISRKMLTSLGQVTGARAQVDLSEACRQSLPFVQASIPEDLILTTHLPSPGPIIRANAEQIQQVVTGLVTNAWEAYGDHKGAIELTVTTVSPVDLFVPHRFPIGWQSKHVTYACLEVKDTGCGIAEEDIDKLFDPFFSNKFTGRGLGLPVVLGIVKSYNGAIAVQSATGRGSTFRVFLPLAAEDNRQHGAGTDLNVKVIGI